MSFFKYGLKRKPNKKSLRKALFLEETPASFSFLKVIDYGALPHRFHWHKPCTYRELLYHYQRSVREHLDLVALYLMGIMFPPLNNMNIDRALQKRLKLRFSSQRKQSFSQRMIFCQTAVTRGLRLLFSQKALS